MQGSCRQCKATINHGEFGGGLVWHPDAGASVDLFKDLGVSGVEPDGSGAVFISGLNHMGFNFGIAGALDRTAGVHWNLREIAHLPGEATDMDSIGPGVFAAWSGPRVVIFNNQRILGLATCKDAVSADIH
jgi:hypothetical protein